LDVQFGCAFLAGIDAHEAACEQTSLPEDVKERHLVARPLFTTLLHRSYNDATNESQKIFAHII
jgi:hypothetical protein